MRTGVDPEAPSRGGVVTDYRDAPMGLPIFSNDEVITTPRNHNYG